MMPIATSVSMSLMLPESMNSFMTALPRFQSSDFRFQISESDGLVADRVREFADGLDLDRHRIARHERPDPFGRAGRNDVSRLQRHHIRDVFDDVLDRHHN